MIKIAAGLVIFSLAFSASLILTAPTSHGDRNITTEIPSLLRAGLPDSTNDPDNLGGSESNSTGSSEQIEFTSGQNTSTFSCNGKVTGYYADVKLQCRVYHFCTQMDGLEGATYQRMSYLCLDNSFFDQKDLNCVKKSDLKVPCDRAEAEYSKSNEQFDVKEESKPSMSDNLAANIMMNPIARYIAGR